MATSIQEFQDSRLGTACPLLNVLHKTCILSDQNHMHANEFSETNSVAITVCVLHSNCQTKDSNEAETNIKSDKNFNS